MTRRSLPAIALALLCAGCPAYLLSGVGAGAQGSETFRARPEEADATLRCGGQPCSEAPLEQAYTSGRSTALFWILFAGEMLGGAALYQAGAGSSPSSSVGGGGTPPPADTGSSGPAPLAVAGGALVALGIADLVAWFARKDEFGERRSPLRLSSPLTADWRGVHGGVPLEAIVPTGAGAVPATFSVARALGVSPAPAAASPAIAPAFEHAAPSATSAAPVSVATAGRAVADGGKVAVLDFKSYSKQLAAEDVRYFADVVRGATLRAAPQLVVMTRENLLVLLQASGKDLGSCEGECEVDTGRRIGADAVVSGEILKVGTRYKLTLRLHETHVGRLLSSAIASGSTIDELDESVSHAVVELTAPLR